MVSFADNADKDNPALMKLYVPESMVRVNSCVLNFEFEPFRAYEKGVASAQQSVYSTSSTNTAVSSSSSEATQTQSTSSASSQTPITSSGGGAQTSSYSGGGSVASSSRYYYLPGSTGDGTMQAGEPSHSHGLYMHGHDTNVPAHTHDVDIPSHSHTVTIASHNHTVTIPSHSHTVNIPGHNHSVTIPAHTHAMEYGIFKTGGVSAGRLYVNGTFRQNVSPNTNYNLAGLLAGADNKISRNTFHRIEIYPTATTSNAQGLTRIVANVFMQIFTNSRGSGDY
jgi:hypothetical protein